MARKKQRRIRETGNCGSREVAIANRVVRVGLTEKVTLDKYLKEMREPVMPIPGRRNSQRSGPQACCVRRPVRLGGLGRGWQTVGGGGGRGGMGLCKSGRAVSLDRAVRRDLRDFKAYSRCCGENQCQWKLETSEEPAATIQARGHKGGESREGEAARFRMAFEGREHRIC